MPLLPIGVLNCECDYLDVPQDMPGENVLSIWLVYWFVIVKRASFITSRPNKIRIVWSFHRNSQNGLSRQAAPDKYQNSRPFENVRYRVFFEYPSP